MKLLNYIIHGDVDKDFYAKYKDQLRERNIRMLKMVFIFSSIISTILFIYAFFSNELSNAREFYGFFAVWFIVLTIPTFLVLPKHPSLAKLFFSILATSILVLTAMLGSYFSRNTTGVTFLVALIFVPGLYIDRPTCSLSSILSSSLIYCILVIAFKSDSYVINVDLINTAFSMVISIIFNIYNMNLHLRSIQSTNSLKEQSRIDELTSMPNRRCFNKSVSEYFSACQNREITIIMMDIDYFKPFNDNYGHINGDDCLSKIGHQLVETAKRLDVFVARFGGEEFVAIDNKRSSHSVCEIAEEFVKDINALNLTHDYSEYKHVTISAGYASYPLSGAQNYMQLINLADEALYKAKSNGRNRCEAYISKVNDNEQVH